MTEDKKGTKALALIAAALVHSSKTVNMNPQQLIGYAKRLEKYLEEEE